MILTVLPGCKGQKLDDPESPALKYGGVKVLATGRTWDSPIIPCAIRILRPAAESTFAPGDLVLCEFELTVPDGGHLPTFLIVDVTSKSDVSMGSHFPNLVRKEGTVSIYRSEFPAPGYTRPFDVRAYGLDTIKRAEVVHTLNDVQDVISGSDQITIYVRSS